MSQIFESTTEKLARILTRQYGVEVSFEGDIPCTDGKTIFLPQYSDLSEDLRKDMSGFLDHEVAHCKFTEFGHLKFCINKLHNLLLQNIEDYRIEKEMINEFPGCVSNLGPLNEKYRGLLNKDWEKRPWPIRMITTIRDIVQNQPHRIDPEYQKYMDLIKDDIAGLRDVSTTKEVREKTEVIIKKIKAEREKEKKEKGEGDEEMDEPMDGEESESDGKASGEKKKGKSGKGKPGEPGEGDDEGPSEGDIDDMLSAKEGSKTAKEMDKFVTSVEGMMEQAFSKKAKEEQKMPSRMDYRIEAKQKNVKIIPITTRFDKITDHSSRGSATAYGALKKESEKFVSAIRHQLERVLKVKENAKWRTERERGAINSRALAQLASNKGYREVFKEFTKTETNNVAVELLIDLSGSMSGPRSETAKGAAIAIAEALKGLDIAFEVTGFCSEGESRMSALVSSATNPERFGRKSERLDLHVYKSFDTVSLQGITELKTGGNNPDGECLSWAAKRLSLRAQKRKILMVFSDGQPATSDASFGTLQADLRTRIAEITRHGIEVIGVGIQTDYVKEFYPDYVILKELKDLPRQAMAKISNLLQQD